RGIRRRSSPPWTPSDSRTRTAVKLTAGGRRSPRRACRCGSRACGLPAVTRPGPRTRTSARSGAAATRSRGEPARTRRDGSGRWRGQRPLVVRKGVGVEVEAPPPGALLGVEGEAGGQREAPPAAKGGAAPPLVLVRPGDLHLDGDGLVRDVQVLRL